MARDLNKVQITGRLGADAVLRYTAQGSALLSFRVATNRTWRSADGQTHEETEWFRVIAWDQLAEQCHATLIRGAHVYIEGRIQTRQWIDQAGSTRSAAEIVASEILLLSSRATSANAPEASEFNAR